MDTPGHDDTAGRDLDDEEGRDVLRAQAADLHNKLKALGHIHTILVIHDQVASNRLNPATFTILKMLDEKFITLGGGQPEEEKGSAAGLGDFPELWSTLQ